MLACCASRSSETSEIGAEHAPVSDPSDEPAVLVGDGKAFIVSGGKGVNGVLKRI